MRLRLSDAATFAALAEHYHTQADVCRQMDRVTVSPFKYGWARAGCRMDEAGAGDRRKSCAKRAVTYRIQKRPPRPFRASVKMICRKHNRRYRVLLGAQAVPGFHDD